MDCIYEESTVGVGEHLLDHQGELAREEQCFQDFEHVGVRGDLLIVHDEDLGLKIEQCKGTIA